MLLRTSAARRFALVSLLVAAALAPPLFAKARSERKAADPQSPPAPAAVTPTTPCGSCDDGDPCTVDRCDAQTGQCVHPAVVCDDQSSCTNDSCDPQSGCRFEPIPDGSVCDVPGICETARVCQAGQCVATPLNCDDSAPCTYDYCDYGTGQCAHETATCGDGNDCTADACDPQTGLCHHTILPVGAACSDQNPCTVGDTCRNFGMGMQCLGTASPGTACDDQNPCTFNDTCIDYGPGSSYCSGTNKDCSDGDPCTGDQCTYPAGQCVHETLTCDDKNPCTTDACDPASGCSNVPVPVDGPCDDRQSCTIDDRCNFGPRGFTCSGTPTVGAACDDGSPCSTADVCIPDAAGSAYCSGSQLECGDGNACTADQCDYQTGACRSAPQPCDDGNTCTLDSCSMTAGCQYEIRPDGSACVDFDLCITGDICQQGSCRGTEVVTCDDQLACTFDRCDYGTGSCQHEPVSCDDGNPCTDDLCPEEGGGGCVNVPRPDGSACSDQNACTQGETCQAGQCTGAPPTPCDDGNPCTTDVCDPATGGCLYVPISCTDFNVCTTDTCNPLTGQCEHPPVSCDDGNDCTNDFCNQGTGTCQHAMAQDGIACDDGNACIDATTCRAGICQGGSPHDCNDNNVCTQETCNPANGCEYTPAPDGTTCNDGNICTVQDRCTAGHCSGAPKCNDFNICTFDSCNSQNGQCTFAPEKEPIPCDDGNACTSGDRCSTLSGQCVGGPPPTCSDGDACTSDSCDPATGGCRFLPRTCDDNSPCTQDSCDPASGCRYDPLPNGSACNDGDACITGESCQYGQCVGLRTICDDGSACTYDFCDGQTGLCRTAPVCDDGNPCTDDVCLPEGGCDYVPHEQGTACDDGNVCTTDDACVDFGMGSPQCRGAATQGAVCDDGNPCTHDDVCADIGAGNTYCQGTYDTCSDGQPCTSDYCDSNTGQCVHDPLICDDRNPCTIDSCGPGENQCSFQPVPAGTACNDSSGCLLGGVCGNGPQGFACNGAPNVGAACDDHNFCTDLDRCQNDGRGNAFCRGNPINCNDDGLICTNDYCDPSIGQCRQSPIYCDDGDVCTVNHCDNATQSCTTEPGQPDEVSTIDADSNTSIHWSPTAGVTHWNSYRGTIPEGYLGARLPGSVYDHACYESANTGGDGALASTDASEPPIGTAYYYDATGEAACGEGPLGKDSAGVVRPNTAPCPTPP